MSQNNEHVSEFIMLANIMRDTATMLEKAYKRAINDGDDHWQDRLATEIVENVITAAQMVGAQADDISYQEEITTAAPLIDGHRSAWLRDCALHCRNEMEVRSLKRFVKENMEKCNLSVEQVEWALKLTLKNIQEL